MEKPKRPKKPTAPMVSEPTENVTDYYFPHDHYPNFEGPAQLVYYTSDELPDDDLEGEEADDWIDANSARSSLTLQQLVDFAASKDASLENVKVGAYVPHRDADYTYVELQVTRHRTLEELARIQEAYNQTMAEYHAKLAEYDEAKASYPRRKAEYELWLAQENLNQLQANEN